MLPPLPQLLHVSAPVHVVKVEIGFLLRLRHFGAKPLLQHRLLVGQPLTQVSPLEPVQILPTHKHTRVSESVASSHLENPTTVVGDVENQLGEASADASLSGQLTP